MRRFVTTIVLATAALLLPAAAATAADVVLPADGATVSSRPNFVVDYPQGTLDVELATTPETLTAGANVGQFVEPAADTFMLIGVGGRPAAIAAWGQAPRLNAGRYFWHVQPNDYATEFARGYVAEPWGVTRTLAVRDEPIVFEGWTLRARRVSRSGCAARYRRAYELSGTIAWSDNQADRVARYAITLRSGTRRTVLKGVLRGSTRFANLVCTNHSAASVSITLRDTAGQLTRGPAKSLRLR